TGTIIVGGFSNATGGLVGILTGSNATIFNSYNLGQVEANGSQDTLGGLVGSAYSSSVISHSYNAGTLLFNPGSSFSLVGGLAGYLGGTVNITNSYNSGAIDTSNVVSSNYIGGLVGLIDSGGNIIDR